MSMTTYNEAETYMTCRGNIGINRAEIGEQMAVEIGGFLIAVIRNPVCWRSMPRGEEMRCAVGMCMADHVRSIFRANRQAANCPQQE